MDRRIGIVVGIAGWLIACSRDPRGDERAPTPPPVRIDAAVAPAPPPAAPIGAHAVAAADGYTCARTGDGHVACWGDLIDGHRAPSPVVVPGLADIAGIAAARKRLVAWTRGGDAWQWTGGAPVRLPVTDVVELAASDQAACARVRDGGVTCWLGTAAATRVLGDASTIAVTGAHACAIAGADVTCWNLDPPTKPAVVVRAHGATALAAGMLGVDDAVFAAVVGGRAIAWTPDGRALAIPDGVPADATAVAIGGADICALGAIVTCWDNWLPAVARPYPGLAGARAVAANFSAGCGAMPDRSVRCWGTTGFVGDGLPLITTTPVEVSGITDAVQLAAGAETFCVRRANGRGACWGTHASPEHARTKPVDLVPIEGAPPPAATARPSSWSGSWFRGDYDCARAGATIRCSVVWHAHGESDKSDAGFPADLTNVVALHMPIGQANQDLCVLRTTGAVECFVVSDGPVIAIPEATGTHAFAQGPTIRTDGLGMMSSTCAVTPTGAVVCWELDDGDTAAKVLTIPEIADAVEVEGSELAACARRKTGRVACWGMTDFLGAGPRTSTELPAVVRGVTL